MNIDKIINRLPLPEKLKGMVKGSSIAMGFRLVGMGINYVFLVYVTTHYDSEGWGVFALCFSILQFLSLTATLGAGAAAFKVVGQGTYEIKSFYRLIIGRVWLPASLIIAALLYFLSPQLSALFNQDGVEIAQELRATAFGIPPFAFAMINAGFFGGMKKIAAFSFFDSLSRFLFGGILVVAITEYLQIIQSLTLIIGFVTGLYVTAVISFAFLYPSLSVNSKIETSSSKNTPSRFSLKDLVELSFPLYLTTLFNRGSIWATTFILGFMLSKSDLGLFDTLYRLSSILTVVLYAVNSYSAPRFAESANDYESLKENAANSGKIMFWATAPLALLLFISGPFILSFLNYEATHFSVEFAALCIFILGQIIDNLTGPVNVLMQMTGLHNLTRNISILSFVIVTLSLVLLGRFGLLVSVICYSFSVILKNVLAAFVVKKKLNVRTYYLPFVMKS